MDRPTIAAYDSQASAQAARFDTADPQTLHSFLLRLLPPARQVLEIGCGSGRDARLLAQHGFTVTATDASTGLLELVHEGDPRIHAKNHEWDYDPRSGREDTKASAKAGASRLWSPGLLRALRELRG